MSKHSGRKSTSPTTQSHEVWWYWSCSDGDDGGGGGGAGSSLFCFSVNIKKVYLMCPGSHRW
jgi:hypothetical protein